MDGEFRDELGNVFKSKKLEPDAIKGIEEFIQKHFHTKRNTNN